MLEIMANAARRKLLEFFVVASCTFDESLATRVDLEELPTNWRNPEPPEELRMIGDEWIRSERSAVLSVPSVIVDLERNYLLNPLHADFKRIKLSRPKPFSFDFRLVTSPAAAVAAEAAARSGRAPGIPTPEPTRSRRGATPASTT
jgi:RES domain-containing protein